MSDPTILVLSSLAEGDKHGYAIMKDVEAFAGVLLGPGTLYGAIPRLEARGWIEPVGAGNRRQVYTITRSGRDHLTAELAGLGQIVRAGLGRLSRA